MAVFQSLHKAYRQVCCKEPLSFGWKITSLVCFSFTPFNLHCYGKPLDLGRAQNHWGHYNRVWQLLFSHLFGSKIKIPGKVNPGSPEISDTASGNSCWSWIFSTGSHTAPVFISQRNLIYQRVCVCVCVYLALKCLKYCAGFQQLKTHTQYNSSGFLFIFTSAELLVKLKKETSACSPPRLYNPPLHYNSQTVFHWESPFTLSQIKNLTADPLHRPGFQILTLWCYKIASSSPRDTIMSRYNEASVHCSPLFGVSWGLCWRLSAQEEFGGLGFCCSRATESDNNFDSQTWAGKEKENGSKSQR